VRASSTAIAVFPTAVGPAMMITVFPGIRLPYFLRSV
jgi:hypothetical protein